MARLVRISHADIIALEQANAKESLAEFAQMAWHVLEPSSKLAWGWALDAICEHLEAVTSGEITRLQMNVPPGSMKSLLSGVIFPAWEWGPKGMPEKRFLGTAHQQNLAVRDNLKCRRLISSEWFQERWPTPIVADQNAKTKFENNATGFREAMAFTSMTGSRGDRVILDDPISADNANSEAELESARLTFTETLPTRVNNDQSSIIVIMQRLNEKDTSGLIKEMGLDYTHLCIPMRYEGDKTINGIGWRDPRTEDGELMFPERFPEKTVAELEKTLGSYATAGQLQQRPAPRGGGMFKREWFETIPAAPAGCRWVRGWDLAASDGADSAWTRGCLMGVAPDGSFVIADMVGIQGTSAAVERLIVNTASQDAQNYRGVKGSIPQDPGQAGKAQVAYLIRQLAGHTYTSSIESGDKVTRAEPLAAQAEVGNIKIVSGEWNKEFLDEVSMFPAGKFKDQVDAAGRAFGELVMKKQSKFIVSSYGAN